MTDPSAGMQISSIAELIRGLEDESFVKAAYLTLLGREADPSGLKAYTALLRQGMRKSEIVSTLATSDEGRQSGPTRKPTDLEALLKAEHEKRHPRPMQRLQRRFFGSAASEEVEEARRELRVAANRSFLIEQSLQGLLRDLQQARAEIAQLKTFISAREPFSPGEAVDGGTARHATAPADSVVPPRAGALFEAMRRYASARFGRVH